VGVQRRDARSAAEEGFLYDSSLQALDEPYEVMSRGKNTGLIELAIDWTLTETPFPRPERQDAVARVALRPVPR
jgi:hypothetical protein